MPHNDELGQTGEDMYSDAAPPAEGEATAPGTEEQPEAADEPRAVLPKVMFAGKNLKPGDQITLTIAAVHDDEIEVSPSGDEEYGEASPPMAGNEMSGMME